MGRRFIIVLIVLAASASGMAARQMTTTRAGALAAPAQVATPGQAPASAVRWPDDRALAIDPAFTIDTLPNGLTSYVRHHEQPAKRVVLRLIVKTGSLHEDDDERGYAHFVEHMAFNGTRHFKPGELVKFFEERGARFGAHVNAATSYESTVYMLTVPSDKPELLDKGLQALADFAGGISFDPREVDAERPIVIEEWRQGQGVGARIDEKQRPILYRGSRFVDRLPIGTRDSVQAATPAGLRRFYEAWYRPERMAVVVVGDVAADRARTLVRRHFAPLKSRAAAKLEPDAAVPLHADLLASIVTDPEITSSSAAVLRKRQESPRPDVATIRKGRVRGLATGMLNTRLAEIARRPDAPFLNASFTAMGLGRDAEAWGFSVRTRDGQLATGLEAVLVEGTRVREHGFVAAELDRVNQSIRAGVESAYKERDKVESVSLAGACAAHFLDGDVPLTPDDSRALALELLDRVTLDEIGREARALMEGTPSVLLATAPEKTGLAAPAEPELREAVVRASAATVTAWEDVAVPRDLMETKPEPGRVASTRTIPELGVTVLTLANGIEAWLKPTDFRNEQIAFSLQGTGGTALAGKERFIEATLATRYVSTAGMGGLSPTQLGKVMAGKLGGAAPFIGPTSTGINGGATPDFLETALQMLHLSVSAPNDDPAALALLKRQLTASLANRSQNPAAAFNDRLNAINYLGHYTTEVPDVPRIERLEIAPMLAFYRERFARARDVHFVMVGAFDLAAVTPLIERYVGSLAMGADRGREGEAPIDLRFASSIVKERVTKGRERAARTVITFPVETTNDLERMTPQGAALGVLQVRLRETLREQLGQTYSVSVARGMSLRPFSTLGTITISFGSAAENVDGLSDAVLREIDRLRREGPTEAELRTWQEQEQRSLETGQKQNRYWMSALLGSLSLGHDPLTILDRGKRITALTRASVHDEVKGLFPADRYTVVSLVPESPAPAPAAGAAPASAPASASAQPPSAPAPQPSSTPPSSASDWRAAPREDWRELFNGRDLDGWVVKLAHHDVGDNYADTFRVENGVIRVMYDKYDDFGARFGHLFYKEKLSHYVLALEYRFFGEQMKGGPDYAKLNSGVMFHSQAPDTILKDQDWPISVEAQFLAGGRTTMNVCTPGTEIFMKGLMVKAHCTNSSSRKYGDEGWIAVEVEVLGGERVRHLLDGRTVLEYEKPSIGGGVAHGFDTAIKKDGTVLESGYIGLQAESQPVEFRNIRLLNLSGCMDPSSPSYRPYFTHRDDSRCTKRP